MSTKYIASNWRLPNEENSGKSDNYGLTFDGTELIDCGADTNLDLNNSFSISTWIKFTSTSSMVVLSKREATKISLLIELGSGKPFTAIRDASSNIAITNTYSGTYNDGNWHHIVATFDRTANELKLYVDNELKETANTSSVGDIAPTTNNLMIGRRSDTSSSFFTGSISECAIFNYPLSSTQISTLYGSSSLGAGNPMALKPQPVAFWNLADNSASNPLTQPNEAVEDASVFKFDDAPSNNFIDLGLINAIENSTSFTLSFWINPSAFTSPFTLLGNKTGYSGDSAKGIAFDVRSTFLIVYLSDDFTDYARVNNPLSLNEWTLLSVVYDGSGSTNADRLKIYYGSTQQTVNTFGGTIPSISPTTGRSLILGKQATGQCIEAKISNFTIFSNALPTTGTESIETLYNNGVPLNSITSENLKAWYKLDQSANWEADSSGNWQIPDAVSAYPQSFSFDGSTQKIQVRNDSFGLTQEITVSAWVRIPNGSAGGAAPNIQVIVSEDTTGGTTRNFALSWRASTLKDFLFEVFSTDGTRQFLYSNAGDVNDGKWHHVVGTWDGTTNANAFKIYVDNVATSTTATKTGINIQSNIPTTIGAIPNTFTWAFEGNISNVQIWDTSLDSTQVQTLYNNGVPLTTAIASDNLKGWWKLDNTATFSTNWSVPDASGNGNTGTSSGMTEQNLVNNNVSALNGESSGMTSANLVLSDLTRAVPYDSYSFNFDAASSDYIQLASSSTAIVDWTQPYSISLWVKYSTSLTWDLMATFGVETGSASTTRYIMIGGNQGYLFTGVGDTDGGGTTIKFNIGSGLNDDNWHHLVYIGDGSSGDFPIVYIDGVVASPSGGTTGLNNSSTYLNVIGTGSDAAGRYFNGKISNVSIFNEALTSTEVLKLYSNGVPQDLTNFTPAPVAWYTLGSNSFWNGSQWTVRDMIGSNDGTGQNIGVDGLVGDAPRSEANGTGTNMDVPTNLEGSTKWSSNNSWSINMSSTARVEDTP